MKKHLVASLLTLFGCVTTSKIRTGPVLAAKAADAPIEVISVAPQRPFTEVALLEVEGPSHLATPEIIEKFQVLAREVGADAVVLGANQISSVYASGNTAGAMVKHQAAAIVWKPAEEAAPKRDPNDSNT